MGLPEEPREPKNAMRSYTRFGLRPQAEQTWNCMCSGEELGSEGRSCATSWETRQSLCALRACYPQIELQRLCARRMPLSLCAGQYRPDAEARSRELRAASR